jgi:hypothetical protein
MTFVYLLGTIVFGLIGVLFTVFGLLGLLVPSRELDYSDRELLWITLAGVGDIVAAALLLHRFLTGV